MTQREQVTLVEAAERLCVPLETVKGWVKRGQLHRATYIRSVGPARRHLVAVYDLGEARVLAERRRARSSATRRPEGGC